jgi:hypothetical protein
MAYCQHLQIYYSSTPNPKTEKEKLAVAENENYQLHFTNYFLSYFILNATQPAILLALCFLLQEVDQVNGS